MSIHATVLTRSVEGFSKKNPNLASHKFFDFTKGDVANFTSPTGEYTHVIHAATDASQELNENNPRAMFSTVVDGTGRVLDFALEKNASRILFLSSGAVYGQQPWEMTHVPESWLGSLNCVEPRNTYAEAKRAAEMLCAIYHKQHGQQIAIARIFALLGPYISLGIHFAAGNFIKDAIDGRLVTVNGNGLPCRSYLYASDLIVWLWQMLLNAKPITPYNVGSDESIELKDLANKIAVLLGNGIYSVLGEVDVGWNPGRYVPNTNLIRNDLGLERTVSLDQAILRTAYWNGWRGE
jgi:dTDP-glucose 4,6-dehydratase